MKQDLDMLKLYEGLNTLSESSFPKRCSSCGRSYASVEEFIQATQSVRTGISGLKSTRDDADRSVVELFRNCPCGSTLMDCFNDRRDLSEKGCKRRELFGELLRILQSKGLATSVARTELCKVLRGEESPLLVRMGVNIKSR